MPDRCTADPERWCEHEGTNDGRFPCVRCGRELGTSSSKRRDETPETGSPKRCRLCGRPCYNGTNIHPCCAEHWTGRFCPSCEASDRFWRELQERWSRPKRSRPTNNKKENQHG